MRSCRAGLKQEGNCGRLNSSDRPQADTRLDRLRAQITQAAERVPIGGGISRNTGFDSGMSSGLRRFPPMRGSSIFSSKTSCSACGRHHLNPRSRRPRSSSHGWTIAVLGGATRMSLACVNQWHLCGLGVTGLMTPLAGRMLQRLRKVLKGSLNDGSPHGASGPRRPAGYRDYKISTILLRRWQRQSNSATTRTSSYSPADSSAGSRQMDGSFDVTW